MDTEESQKWRAAHKLYANFQLLRGISSLPQPLSCSVVSYNIIFLFQKKILLTCEWVKSLSRVRLFATLWTGAHQAPQSIGFSRQEYWIGRPYPPPRDLPHPEIQPMSLVSFISRQILYHWHLLGSPFHVLSRWFFNNAVKWELLISKFVKWDKWDQKY